MVSAKCAVTSSTRASHRAIAVVTRSSIESLLLAPTFAWPQHGYHTGATRFQTARRVSDDHCAGTTRRVLSWSGQGAVGTHSGHRGGRDQDQQRSNKISAGGRVGVDDVTHPLLYRLNVLRRECISAVKVLTTHRQT